jgi:hypothetical protein
LLEIAGHARAQILCLADIEDFVCPALHEVQARTRGEGPYLPADVLKPLVVSINGHKSAVSMAIPQRLLGIAVNSGYGCDELYLSYTLLSEKEFCGFRNRIVKNLSRAEKFFLIIDSARTRTKSQALRIGVKK